MANNRGKKTTDDNVAGDEVVEETTAPAMTDKPADDHVPLSSGMGGRYKMVNGKRVKRDD